MSERIKGVVKWFNSKKGYGFASRDDGQGDVFIHWSDIKSEGFKTLEAGDRVEFSVQTDQKGPRAKEVRKAS